MKSKQQPNWKCSAVGPLNNGLLKECGFEYYFDPQVINTPHCPQCGSKMSWFTKSATVSELLRQGFEAEKNK